MKARLALGVRGCRGWLFGRGCGLGVSLLAHCLVLAALAGLASGNQARSERRVLLCAAIVPASQGSGESLAESQLAAQSAPGPQSASPAQDVSPRTQTQRAPEKERKLADKRTKAKTPSPRPEAPGRDGPGESAAKPETGQGQSGGQADSGSGAREAPAGGQGNGANAQSWAGTQGPGNYFGSIVARLEQVKRYPEEVRRLGREGTVLVRFELDKAGAVLSCQIEKGSGQSGLDQEVLRMVRKASPFPPIPEDLKRERLVLVIPVSFSLRQG